MQALQLLNETFKLLLPYRSYVIVNPTLREVTK